MGIIISLKILSEDKIIYKIKLESQEALELKNAIKNIYTFAADLCNTSASIIQKGKEGVTKYFKIPFSLRFRKKKAYETLSYQKLETATKIFYIYIINKDKIL